MKKLLFAILFLFPLTHASELSDVLINSDAFILDKSNNIATFEKNVILWFDGLVLKTSKLKIIYKINGDKRTIDRIIMPNKINASKENDGQTLIADNAEYFADTKKLVLKGNVALESVDNILKTEELVYYMAFKKVKPE